LAKTLDTARATSTRPASVPSLRAHTATINDLDGSRLSLLKSIGDTEDLIASKEAELATLKEQARKLEVYDAADEHDAQLDGNTYVYTNI
jgi:kinetochore protein Spc24, fungi type